jgi:hypothetical protein
MFRKRISLDANSEASEVFAALRKQCMAAGLPSDEVDQIVQEAIHPVTAMIESGRSVLQANGQFRATREVVTKGSAITFDAYFGVKPPLLTRLKTAILG